MKQFFGKYRGQVKNNTDPMQLGRIQISCPTVLGSGSLSWAMPCVPYAGKGVGFFAIPPVGANIWVEFEGGNIDYPIWSGCFWGAGEVPAKPAIEQMKVFKTDSITIELNDMPGAGGATLEVNSPGVSVPLKMTFNSAGIEIDCNPANVKLTPKGIELNIPPTAIKMDSSKLEAASAPSSIKLSASGVEATNGPAALKLNGPKVDINNGAVEVI